MSVLANSLADLPSIVGAFAIVDVLKSLAFQQQPLWMQLHERYQPFARSSSGTLWPVNFAKTASATSEDIDKRIKTREISQFFSLVPHSVDAG